MFVRRSKVDFLSAGERVSAGAPGPKGAAESCSSDGQPREASFPHQNKVEMLEIFATRWRFPQISLIGFLMTDI